MEPNPSFSISEKLAQFSPDVWWILDGEGFIQHASELCVQVIGYEAHEMLAKHYATYLHPQDIVPTNRFLKSLSGSGKIDYNNRCIHKDGHTVYLHWHGAWAEDDGMFGIVGRDVTEQKLRSEQLHEKVALHSALVEHGSDLLSLFDENVNFIYSSGSTCRILGYQEDELKGASALQFIHPDDLERVYAKLNDVLATEGLTEIPDFRFRHANGEWRWLETSISNQLHNPAVQALVSSSRDITQHYLNKQLLQESEQRFRSLFDDNPDIVLAENREGMVIDINHAGCAHLGLPKEVILNRHFSDFLPADAIKICSDHLHKAISGSTVTFNLEADFAPHGKKVMEITKVPVKVNGEVIAVHSILKDVTAATNYHKAVNQHAKKLNNIFESITDAFCTIDRNWCYTYVNSEFENLTQISKEHYLGKSFFDLYPEYTKRAFYEYYRYAMETGNSVHFEAYSPEFGLWLNIKAYPSEEGLSIYFNDITEKVRSKEQMERLSLVASKTTHGVVITNAHGLTEWVNESFTRMTGYTLEEMLGEKPGAQLQGPETDPATVRYMSEKLAQQAPFNTTLVNYKKTGEKMWLSIDITPVLDTAGNVTQFIAIQKDITKRINSQQELSKLSLVASKTNNGVIIADKDYKIEWVNDGFTHLTGYSLSEAMGKEPSQLLRSTLTDEDTFAELDEKFKTGEQVSFEVLEQKKNGEQIWMNVDVNALFEEDGTLSGYIEVLTDITDLKNSKDKLTQLAQDLYRHNSDLQQFTYIVSHNLRSPVANALGLTGMLAKLDKDTKQYEMSLDYLRQSIQHLDNVLTDMNTILSIRDKKESIEQEQVEVHSVLNQVLSDFQEPLLQCGGELFSDIPEGLSVKANKAYLYSIFHNLLSNAIKYRSNERLLRVHVACSDNSGQGTIITVEDNGIGFDQKKADGKIFQLYKRFHADRKGRGIGLYLVKSHLEAMGGHIEVHSQVDGGTKFLMHLPK